MTIAITILTVLCVVGLFLIYDNMRLKELLREEPKPYEFDEADVYDDISREESLVVIHRLRNY